MKSLRLRSRPASKRSSAPITPMVDLFANLLLIFLASSPIFAGKSIELPSWSGETRGCESPGKVAHRLIISGEERLSWDGEPLTDEALVTRLRESARLGSTVTIVLDATVAFERFWDVYRRYLESGFKQPPSLSVRPEPSDRG